MMRLLVAKNGLAAEGQREGWTSIADIGLSFGGKRLTFIEYVKTEARYLEFVERLFASLDCRHPLVAEPIVGMPLPNWLPEFRNGTALDLDCARRVVRAALRGMPLGATLEFPEEAVRIRVGFDFYLMVDIPERYRGHVTQNMPAGLEVVSEEEFEDTDDYCSDKADDSFWADLSAASRDAGKPLWILEQWAYGDWGERWYLAEAEQMEAVRSSVQPNSMVRAKFDPHHEVITLSDYFHDLSADSVDLPGLKVFSDPPLPELLSRPLTRDLLASDLATVTVSVVRSDDFIETSEYAGVMPDDSSLRIARWLR